MPSDSKKREQARKKDAQKKRNQKITTVGKDENEPTTNGTTNGASTNGAPVEMTEEGNEICLIFSFFLFCFFMKILS